MEDTGMNKPITETPIMERPARVEQAISNAMEMVRAFSERDPHDGDAENPWKNPAAMLQQLDRARDEIVAAKDDKEESTKTTENEHDFRAAYMDMVTNAFADVLEDMRNNGEEDLDVNALVDCLQSGLDFMSGEDKELFQLDEDDDDDILDDGTPTPHEQRRLELGVH